MKFRSSSLLVSIGLCSISAALVSASEPQILEIRTVDELRALAPLLQGNTTATSAAPLMVRLSAGTYVLEDSIRILRSDVSLCGEPGTKLVLAAGVNEPVIAVGTQEETPSAGALISRVTIADLEIDGNMDGQTSETSPIRPWIRNNGIDARAVSHLTVERVNIQHARSGGIVISYRCADVQVRDSVFAANYFDGLAFYDSERVTVADCVMCDNHAAGISLDNDFRDSVFSRCTMRQNGDVGIFARNTHHVRFESCTIKQSGNWAAFLGHDDANQGVTGIRIEGCEIRQNRGGVFLSSLNEQQSSAVHIADTSFAANLVDGRSNWYSCGAPLLTANLTEEPAATGGTILPIATVPTPAF
jgi:hypothetical protein